MVCFLYVLFSPIMSPGLVMSADVFCCHCSKWVSQDPALTPEFSNRSRIRRVKCGEEKPACLRCTSTGRTCDGYDKDRWPARNRTVVTDPLEGAELARTEFLAACRHNEALRYMRPLAPDINNVRLMRRPIAHRFPPFSSSHTGDSDEADDEHNGDCAFTVFFNRISASEDATNPQIPAVHHAVTALDAAFQLASCALPEAQLPEGFATPEALDIFSVQHYNLSISSLQPQVSSSNPDSARITLLCCLAFVFLETLRQNHAEAITHLINGLRILASLPAAVLEGASLLSGRLTDHLSMPEIINIFGRLEVSVCFIPNALRPVVASAAFRSRHSDDGSTYAPLAGYSALRTAAMTFHRDVMSHLHSPDSSLSPALLGRSARLDMLFAPFLAPARTLSPATHLCLLQFRSAQALLAGAVTPATHAHIHRQMLRHILALHAERDKTPRLPTPTPFLPMVLTEVHLAAPLYILAAQTEYAPALRAQAILLLASTLQAGSGAGPPGEEGDDYALVLQRLEGVVAAMQGESLVGSTDLPRGLIGLGCLPGVWDALLGLADGASVGSAEIEEGDWA